jgi:hypothetical protein
MRTSSEPSITALVTGIISDGQELIKQQFALLRREVEEEIEQAKTAALFLALGAGIVAVGGLLLAFLLVYLLANTTTIPLWGCFGIVGGGLATIGALCLYFGRREAADVVLTPPPQTAEAIKENVQWLKEQTTSNKT